LDKAEGRNPTWISIIIGLRRCAAYPTCGLVSIPVQRKPFETTNMLSKFVPYEGPISFPSKIKSLFALGSLVIQITMIFFPVPALANEVGVIHYKPGFNYFNKSEAGPINLITDFYEDNYRQFRTHAIRFYYKSTDDNTLHEIKTFIDAGITKTVDISNVSGPDCEFSLARLVRKGDELTLISFTRQFNTNLTYADPSILNISLFWLANEKSALDTSQYHFKKYKQLNSKKAMCTLDEIDDYLRSNLSKLVN
jgi:hypothetical protein